MSNFASADELIEQLRRNDTLAGRGTDAIDLLNGLVTNFNCCSMAAISKPESTMMTKRCLLVLVLVTAYSVAPQAQAQSFLFGVDSATGLSIADIETGIPIRQIPTGLSISVSLSPDHTRAYVSDFSEGQLLVFDTESATLLAAIPVFRAMGIAVLADHSAVYVASRETGSVKVIDPASLSIVSSITIPTGLPRALALSPTGDRLYVAGQDSAGTLTVVDTSTESVLGSTPTANNAHHLSLDPTGSRAYVTSRVPTIGHDILTVVDTTMLEVEASIRLNPAAHLCPCAGQIAVDPAGNRYFVATGSHLLEYSTSTNELASAIELPDESIAIELRADGAVAYLGGIASYQVYDTLSRTVTPLAPCEFCGREDIALSTLGPEPTPRYFCQGFSPPLDQDVVELRGRQPLLFRAELLSEAGMELANQDLAVPPRLRIDYILDAGDLLDVTDAILGSIDPSFEFVGGQWRFRLRTTNFQTDGDYLVRLESGDAGEYSVDPACTAQLLVD